jgi:D-arginine dehydrogenase
MSSAADVLIIGGGIAGVSLVGRLVEKTAGKARIVLLEREDQLQYHATSRSAAVFIESYGNAQVRAWTRESRAFFERPPAGFTEHPLAMPRPVLYVARRKDAGELDALLADNPGIVHEVPAAEALSRMPVLRPDVFARFAEEPGTFDIDVNGLFEGFRRMAARGGVEMLKEREVKSLSHGAGGWTVATAQETFTAPIVVNAAGAWAGRIGVMAGMGDRGLQPMLRTAIRFEPPRGMDVSHWMLVNDLGGAFYFKPDAGQILASPVDETPVEPHDAQSDDTVVAELVERLAEATTITVGRKPQSWAGLRTFTPGRTPIAEFDRDGFFWLAGQGGYGMQTAPALSARAAALIAERL